MYHLENIPTDALVQELVNRAHQIHVDRGWWHDLKTSEDMRCNYLEGERPKGSKAVGETVSLIHSEVSEAYEAHRKDLWDDKIPRYKGFEAELADAMIRILDAAGGYRLRLASALMDKLEYNKVREDHSVESRLGTNGKST